MVSESLAEQDAWSEKTEKKTMATAVSSSRFDSALEPIFSRNQFDIRLEAGFTVAFSGITGLAENLERRRAHVGSV